MQIAGLTVRARDFDDDDIAAGELSGEPGSIRPGSFDPDRFDFSVLLQPLEGLYVALGGGWELAVTEQLPGSRVECGAVMGGAVGIDAADHFAIFALVRHAGDAVLSLLGGWTGHRHRQADNTEMGVFLAGSYQVTPSVPVV